VADFHGNLSVEQLYHTVIALASTSPDASTAAPLATRGTTSTSGQRKSVSPRDWSADMVQWHCGRSERRVPAYPCL